jgi:ribonuclease HI
MIEIYTDGSCLKNCGGGHGGWGFIMILEDIEYHVSGSNDNTTNNRMELQAVIEAITFNADIVSYKIYTDSQLVLQCAKGNWKRKANLDLWEIYNKASMGKYIEWEWVKAHNGNKYNELVDKLARNAAKENNK